MIKDMIGGCLPDRRGWLHFPCGVVNAALFVVNPYLALLFGAGFLVYELSQGGKPWKDIQGWLWGLVVVAPLVYYFLKGYIPF